MKERLSLSGVLGVILLVGFTTIATASVKIPGEVGAEKHTLGIAAHVPPALIYVIDPQGKRAGMDPDGPVSPTGGGRKINERENTDVESQNIASDDPEDEGEGQATTMWDIGLFDVPAGEYIVVLRGLRLGETEVHVDRFPVRSGGLAPTIKTSFIIGPGVERRLRVQFDPNQVDGDGNLFTDVRRLVQGDDLARDVDTACLLGQVSPEGICRGLKAKAAAAAKALKRGRKKAARGAVNAFLNELKAQEGKHVQEPALTILREEAEALLNPPPPLSKPKVKSKTTAKAK